MKRLALPIVMILAVASLSSLATAQSIRKDYREMTPAEKQAFVDALNQLWAEGVISNYEQIHIANMNDIHRGNNFTAWHRQYILEFEEELKRINPDISLPYWDWTEDRSTTPEWNNSDFLGQFNTSWSLNRNLGGSSSLPTSAHIAGVLALTSFTSGGTTGNGFGGTNAVGDLERRHNAIHNWVGGVMLGSGAPRDPIFFLHHAIIDKIWQQWDGVSTFTATSLPVYTDINPHDIVDSRVLKVWYAEDGLVTLDQYEVEGQETYRYTGVIAAENFTVPSGTECTFESGSQIILRSGFNVAPGASFTASVTSSGPSATGASGTSTTSLETRALEAESQDQRDAAGSAETALAEDRARIEASSKVQDVPTETELGPNYPNPFNASTVIVYSLKENSRVTLKVYNMVGQEVATLVDGYQAAGRHTTEWHMRDGTGNDVVSGTYVYRMEAGDFVQARSMVLVK